jgi:hypothetical protein
MFYCYTAIKQQISRIYMWRERLRDSKRGGLPEDRPDQYQRLIRDCFAKIRGSRARLSKLRRRASAECQREWLNGKERRERMAARKKEDMPTGLIVDKKA